MLCHKINSQNTGLEVGREEEAHTREEGGKKADGGEDLQAEVLGNLVSGRDLGRTRMTSSPGAGRDAGEEGPASGQLVGGAQGLTVSP